MAYENEEITIGERQKCHAWPLGQCTYGAECFHTHHPNLDPALPSTRKHHEFSVSNTVGEACQRCLQAAREASLHLGKCSSCANMVQCDKKGRGGDDDPCSECRWFGGESCRCSIASDTSYNDQLWGVMMTRGNADYTLPPNRSREVGRIGKAPPAPMPDAKVKVGWEGATKDQLLAKADMLPRFVRDLPRAYLVPPRASAKVKKSKAFKANEDKRKRDTNRDAPSSITSAASTVAATLPQFPAPPSFLRPPPDTRHGEVVNTSWSWVAGVWEHTYASGAKVTGRKQSANSPSGQAQLPSVCHSCLMLKAMSLIEQRLQNKRSVSITSSPRPISKPGLPPPTSPAIGHRRSMSISDDDRRPEKKRRIQ